MARYKEKDSTDLRWNRIRRRITRELDTQITDWREHALNRLLTAAWDEYVKQLAVGETVELEAHYETWVAQALNESVNTTIEPADEVATK